MTGPRRSGVSAVVLAFGPEPLLEQCVESIVGSGEADEVILVDNGADASVVQRVGQIPSVTVLKPGRNTGFAGGCNLAARQASGRVLVLVNSDAVCRPGAIRALAEALESPGVGISTASIRYLDRPDVINTAGNPVHFTGLSWAGGLGDSADQHSVETPVASASGCAMAVRREVWDELDGFYEPMFAYLEDTELSLRCWMAGWSVKYVPKAVVLHDYEFSRNSSKLYLLERNRLILLCTLFQTRTLAAIAVPLLALEAAILIVAVRQGWWREKVRGWHWCLRHRHALRERRRLVQRSRRRSDAALIPLLTGAFTPGGEAGVSQAPFLSRLSNVYWSAARRWLLVPGAPLRYQKGRDGRHDW